MQIIGFTIIDVAPLIVSQLYISKTKERKMNRVSVSKDKEKNILKIEKLSFGSHVKKGLRSLNLIVFFAVTNMFSFAAVIAASAISNELDLAFAFDFEEPAFATSIGIALLLMIPITIIHYHLKQKDTYICVNGDRFSVWRSTPENIFFEGSTSTEILIRGDSDPGDKSNYDDEPDEIIIHIRHLKAGEKQSTRPFSDGRWYRFDEDFSEEDSKKVLQFRQDNHINKKIKGVS